MNKIISSELVYRSDGDACEKRRYVIHMPEDKWSDFEELLNNIDQYLGKPSHVFNVRNTDMKWTLLDPLAIVTIKGSDTARNFAFENIQNFINETES